MCYYSFHHLILTSEVAAEDDGASKHGVAAFEVNDLLVFVDFRQVIYFLLEPHERAVEVWAQLRRRFLFEHRRLRWIFNFEKLARSELQIFVDHKRRRHNYGFRQSREFLHFFEVAVGNGCNFVVRQDLEHFEGNVVLRDDDVGIDESDFFKKDVEIRVFEVDGAVDVCVRVFAAFLVLAHEPQTAFQKQDFRVVDRVWHPLVAQVFQQHETVDVLALALVLEVEELDVNVFVKVHAVFQVSAAWLNGVNCLQHKLMKMRSPHFFVNSCEIHFVFDDFMDVLL